MLSSTNIEKEGLLQFSIIFILKKEKMNYKIN
jgi:hypothetical protein